MSGYHLTDYQANALARLVRAGGIVEAPVDLGPRRTTQSLRARGLIDVLEDRVELTVAGQEAMPLEALEAALVREVYELALAKYGRPALTTTSAVMLALELVPRASADYAVVRRALKVLEAEGRVRGYGLAQGRFNVPSAGAALEYASDELPVDAAYWLDVGPAVAVEAIR